MKHPQEIRPEELPGLSEYVAEALRRWRLEPAWIGSGAIPEQPEGVGVEAGLRRRRQLGSVNILWRDVSGQASLEETGQALSGLAVGCLETALAAASSKVAGRHGTLSDADGKPLLPAVIGLGKLGGNELNFNSDLDLVFVYSGDGESAGPRRLVAREYLTLVVRELVRLMDEVTADGRVWPIDTRLRPFGQSGALLWSAGAMEQYFQNEGRTWERYAWLKARPVAGDHETARALLDRLRPFVFRRYLDYGLFDSLRRLQSEIDRATRRSDHAEDIKRGRGGIRELEFLVQSIQLLRGGREETLRVPGFLPALSACAGLGLIEPEEAGAIEADYRFLRTLENRLQAVTGRRTHRLPAEGRHRAGLARLMASDDWPTLATTIETVRRRVHGQFEQRFSAPPAHEETLSLWPPGSETEKDLAGAGFRDPRAAAGRLMRLTEYLARRPLTAEARRRLDDLMPRLLAEICRHDRPDPGFADLLALIESIARRSAYMALLCEQPATLARLVRVFRVSARVAGWIIASPQLLDDLLDPVHGRGLPAAPEMDPSDPEASLESLARFRQAGFLSTALGELDGALDGPAARAQLTGLAETVISRILSLLDQARTHPLAVIGYGNLGGGELHYDSDLDLVFLHPEGPPPLRRAQRLISYMQLPLAGGRLYTIDTRLRPNGQAGLLVSSLDSFASYQADHAWEWEHQALIRARWVAGERSLAEPFEEVRGRVLARPRDTEKTRRALAKMRARQRLKRGETPVRAVLADVQFVAELGVLLTAAREPGLLGLRRTADQLAALADCDWLDAGKAGALSDAWRAAGRARDRDFLERDAVVEVTGDVTARVREIWTEVFG